tara:strand:+ start:656 stop:862 length:207 start_codon:yes stop_codon:yes gene_type:complete
MNKNTQDQDGISAKDRALISQLCSEITRLKRELRDSNEAISHYQDVERTLLKKQGLTGDEVPYVNPSN